MNKMCIRDRAKVGWTLRENRGRKPRKHILYQKPMGSRGRERRSRFKNEIAENLRKPNIRNWKAIVRNREE